MNKNKLSEQISKALKDLGYADGTWVKVEFAGIDRYELSVDGEVIGIWDSRRKTFVE